MRPIVGWATVAVAIAVVVAQGALLLGASHNEAVDLVSVAAAFAVIAALAGVADTPASVHIVVAATASTLLAATAFVPIAAIFFAAVLVFIVAATFVFILVDEQQITYSRVAIVSVVEGVVVVSALLLATSWVGVVIGVGGIIALGIMYFCSPKSGAVVAPASEQPGA